MLTNTAATLYNRYTEEGEEKYSRTVLEAVSWQAGRSYTLSGEVVSGGSTVDVFIPISVETDGKPYLPPKQFTPDGFTFNKQDYLVKGVCDWEYSPEHPIKELLSSYDNVVTIISVETCDYGSPEMSHWEVGCR